MHHLSIWYKVFLVGFVVMSEIKSFIKTLIKLLPLVAVISILSSHIVAVPTNSMNPSIKAGDVVIVQKTDVLGAYSELNPDDVKVGDIVVYEKKQNKRPVNESYKSDEKNSSDSESKECIIHRVVAVHKVHGKKHFILKGDNNRITDSENVNGEQVVGKAVIWGGNPVTVPQIGNIIFHIKSSLNSIGL
jgi:signal peptidase I